MVSPDPVDEVFAGSGSVLTLHRSADRAPQRMQARKTEAKIMEVMPPRVWLSCTAVARLIGAPDDRKTRARLDRLVSDCKLERKREQGTHGPVHLFRRS
jgi:hypothetical protein